MRKFPVIFDLETKHTFRQFDDPKKLGISVAALYDYKTNQSMVFLENQLNKLYPLLENCSYIIGFNVRSFDLEVLQGYYPGKIDQFAVFDILEDIKHKLGKRLSLNDIVMATLGKKKTGHGLQAVNYYQTGEWEKLKQYCLDDVMLTKEIFDFGVKNGKINYLTAQGRQTIPVNWKRYLEEEQTNDRYLTLPF